MLIQNSVKSPFNIAEWGRKTSLMLEAKQSVMVNANRHFINNTQRGQIKPVQVAVLQDFLKDHFGNVTLVYTVYYLRRSYIIVSAEPSFVALVYIVVSVEAIFVDPYILQCLQRLALLHRIYCSVCIGQLCCISIYCSVCTSQLCCISIYWNSQKQYNMILCCYHSIPFLQYRREILSLFIVSDILYWCRCC